MRLRTIGLLVTLALGLLAAPLAAEAQPPGKVYRIGFLFSLWHERVPAFLESLRQGLREFGYIEGQNIAIEYRWAQEDYARLPELAADLVRLKVDVIVAGGNQAIAAAKQATASIPIVMVLALDPVGQGFISSLARPGGNVTGFTWETEVEIAGKYVELLKEVVPKLSRVANLVDPDLRGIEPYRKAAEDAARRLGLTLQAVEIRGPNPNLENAFGAMVRQRAEAVVVFGSAMIHSQLRQIVDLAAKHRMPATYPWREAAVLGGLMSYGVSLTDMYKRAATHVAKILKGAKPAELPVEQPTRFELVVNLKTAKALGLTIPQSILIRADQVIK